jgi:hypothetical protein
VVTALTAQNTCGITAIHTPPPTFLAAQLDTLFADLPVAAIKTGMLGNRAVIETVAAALRRWFPDPAALPPLVVDPVMIATSGDRLLDADAVSVLVEQLLPLATVVTPNLPEAAALTGLPEATSRAEMRRTAERLRALLPATSGRWVVLKGGHLPGDELVDLAFEGKRCWNSAPPANPLARFTAPVVRLPRRSPRNSAFGSQSRTLREKILLPRRTPRQPSLPKQPKPVLPRRTVTYNARSVRAPTLLPGAARSPWATCRFAVTIRKNCPHRVPRAPPRRASSEARAFR